MPSRSDVPVIACSQIVGSFSTRVRTISGIFLECGAVGAYAPLWLLAGDSKKPKRRLCTDGRRTPKNASPSCILDDMNFTPAQRVRHIGKSATRVLYDSAPPGSINLGLGEPDFVTPEVVRKEAMRVICEEPITYTTNAGILPLRERIAEYHSDGASVISPEAVC